MIAKHISTLPLDYQVILLVELFSRGMVDKDTLWYKEWITLNINTNLVEVIAELVDTEQANA